jgi:hypothetical protein
MGAEPGRPNEPSPITRIDTARVRPVQSAAGRSFIEPGSPWQNPFVESFGSRVRDEVLSVEAFDSVLEAQTVITDWRTIYNHRRPHSSLGWRPPAAYAASLTTNKSEKPADSHSGRTDKWEPGQIRRRIAAGRALTPTVELSAHSEHATHRPACSHPACAFACQRYSRRLGRHAQRSVAMRETEQRLARDADRIAAALIRPKR